MSTVHSKLRNRMHIGDMGGSLITVLPCSTSMRVLYYAELAYYASSILMLALWEVPRKDQAVMMLHHWATVTLIAFSHAYK